MILHDQILSSVHGTLLNHCFTIFSSRWMKNLSFTIKLPAATLAAQSPDQ